MHIQKTDYLALILAALVLPFVFFRAKYTQILSLTSNLRVYSDAYFYTQIKCPLSTVILNTTLHGQRQLLPHLLAPHYDYQSGRSYIDAIAMVGLQRELFFGQRFSGLRYVSPYQRKSPVLYLNRRDPKDFRGKHIDASSEDDTHIASEAYVMTSDTGTTSRIKSLTQDPESRIIVGLSEALDVFALSESLDPVWTSTKISETLLAETARRNITELLNFKVMPVKGFALLSVVGKSADKEAHIFMISLSAHSGAILWTSAQRVTPRASGNATLDDSLVRVVPLDDREESLLPALQTLRDNPWNALALYLSYQVHFQRQHGQTHTIRTTQPLLGGLTLVALHSPQYISLFDLATGTTIASFAIAPGVTLSSSKGDLSGALAPEFLQSIRFRAGLPVHATYLSEDYIEESNDYVNAVRVRLVCGEPDTGGSGGGSGAITFIPLSERSNFLAITPKQSVTAPTVSSTRLVSPALDEDQASGVVSERRLLILGPNGVLYCVSAATNRILWRAQLKDFLPTTLNAHLSVQPVSAGTRVVVLTLRERVYVFDLVSGETLAFFTLMEQENLQFHDTGVDFYDDELARVASSILVGRLHPYEKRNSVIVSTGPFMDVAGVAVPGGNLVSFWERLGLFCLVAIVLAALMRVFPSVASKAD